MVYTYTFIAATLTGSGHQQGRLTKFLFTHCSGQGGSTPATEGEVSETSTNRHIDTNRRDTVHRERNQEINQAILEEHPPQTRFNRTLSKKSSSGESQDNEVESHRYTQI